MRLAAYAGASTVLAAGIILRAFHERPNFYSATVYLSQSSACRMILLNLLILSAYGIMRALQKLLYGPLRAIEREQLWDKAWYAVTETALAMTTFRGEVGTWFFVMFVGLLAGKVWSWLSEARVEALEQQPPANPRLFHMRLIISLALSELFDFAMLRYCVQTLFEQPRPGMMVMFAFEFAVLAISSTSTALKYMLALQEKFIIKRQMKARIEEQRQDMRLAREEAQRQRETSAEGGEESGAAAEPLAEEEEIDENEIDVPGWQEKGRWVLLLDLLTDLCKLLVYVCFFTVLLMFHGIPIHIIRDVFMTTRSFLKRIADFLKYRNATKDMNARYPDATAEELGRDGTCIICREEMRPWQQPAADPAGDAAANRRPSRLLLDERQRPKKLPCGHILHFGCLRSWLERQQVCPTCRSSVLAPTSTQGAQPGANPGPGPPGAQPGGVPQPGQNPQAPRPNVRRARTFNLGPWRFAFAAGDERQVRDALQALRQDNEANAAHAQHGGLHAMQQGGGPAQTLPGVANALNAVLGGHQHTEPLQDQIRRIEEQFAREFNALAAAEEQLAVVRGLQHELERLRDPTSTAPQGVLGMPNMGALPPEQILQHRLDEAQQMAHMRRFQPYMRIPAPRATTPSVVSTEQQVLAPHSDQVVLESGHPDLPTGFSLPQGWSLLPLQRTSTPSDTLEPVLPQVSILPQQETSSQPQASTHPNNANIPAPIRSDDADSTSHNSDTPIPNTIPTQSSSQHQSSESNGGQSSEAEQTDLDIPDWGNSGYDGPAARTPQAEAVHDNGSSDEQSASHSNGNIGDIKGKSKATTVEDVMDEDQSR